MLDPDLEMLYSDLEMLYPDLEMLYPDLVMLYPELEMLYPDLEMPYPDLEMLYPAVWSQTHLFYCIRVWETIGPFGTNGCQIGVQIWDGSFPVSTNHKPQSIILLAVVHFIHVKIRN